MEKLGIDLKLLVVQIVNFVLLLFILKKVMYKPILEAIKKRKEELDLVEKQKNDIENSKKDLEIKQKKIISDALNEKDDILKNAKREAEAGKKRIIEKANMEAKELLQGTKRQIERDSRK